MAGRLIIDGIEVVLAARDEHESEWLDFDSCAQRCRRTGCGSPARSRR
jgi:hypothetical protein